MPQGSSGEWHTGEVVNLCKSYGFIRISKDGKSEDIFFYYGDVKGREPQLGDQGARPCPPTTTADHSSNASCASIPHYPPTTPCARLRDALQPAV